jgi:hypothetical protein
MCNSLKQKKKTPNPIQLPSSRKKRNPNRIKKWHQPEGKKEIMQKETKGPPQKLQRIHQVPNNLIPTLARYPKVIDR